MNTQSKSDFQIAIIGAGFAGLTTAIRLLQSGRNSFVILERAAEVGGTWRDNIYPGCGCDVPSHLYSISFEPNPNWTRKFSKQPEILQYIKHCVKKYNLEPHIRYNAEVTGLRFNETDNNWKIETKDGNAFAASVVLAAPGPLNRPNIPDFKGFDRFQGVSFHSSGWNYDFDLTGKKVAVIGTGASAVQFIPEIAPEVEHLYVFQRTPHWIVPKPDRQFFSFEKKIFAWFPWFQKIYRNLIYWVFESRGYLMLGNKTFSKYANAVGKFHLKRQVKDPEMRKALTPNYQLGCKRILPSNDFYPALTRDNVTLVTKSIEEINENCIQVNDGKDYEIDAIIFATGFIASEMDLKMDIIGLDGRNLMDEWRKEGPEAYYGLSVSGFPNLLFLVGPNTGLGHNSIIHMIESQVNYVMDYLNLLENLNGKSAFNLKPKVQESFNRDIQERLKTTIWQSGGCKSWYQTASGKNTTLWPGFTTTYRKETKLVNPDDYLML